MFLAGWYSSALVLFLFRSANWNVFHFAVANFASKWESNCWMSLWSTFEITELPFKSIQYARSNVIIVFTISNLIRMTYKGNWKLD
jgi:hypothetical protein